jgi:cyclophilin family peptidyl-prolyl cis-trans isomerase
MPRKKQIVQKQQRRKAYNENMSGEATQIKRKGVFRVFDNYKLFVILGVGGLVLSIGAGAFLTTSGTLTEGGAGVRGADPIPATAEPEGTPSDSQPRPDEPAVRTYSAPPPVTIDEDASYVAVIRTEKGDIRVRLFTDEAPLTVNNFVFLAREGFYDGLTFHRVIEGFVAQAGDPTGTGAAGPGYDLEVEALSDSFPEGVLAMAKPQEAGRPNNGSQFFFTLSPQPTFEGKFTVFGEVIEGMDVLRGLTTRDPQLVVEADPGDVIETIEIIEEA